MQKEGSCGSQPWGRETFRRRAQSLGDVDLPLRSAHDAAISSFVWRQKGFSVRHSSLGSPLGLCRGSALVFECTLVRSALQRLHCARGSRRGDGPDSTTVHHVFFGESWGGNKKPHAWTARLDFSGRPSNVASSWHPCSGLHSAVLCVKPVLILPCPPFCAYASHDLPLDQAGACRTCSPLNPESHYPHLLFLPPSVLLPDNSNPSQPASHPTTSARKATAA
jgi:hypothetical protein